MSGGSALALDWCVVMVPHRAARRADRGGFLRKRFFSMPSRKHRILPIHPQALGMRLNAINEVPHPEAARSAVSKDGALTRIEQS